MKRIERIEARAVRSDGQRRERSVGIELATARYFSGDWNPGCPICSGLCGTRLKRAVS